mmetsp:Transcript_56/g.160  ORF Transcript_56/g.160 Transcript_56/m.160 type:complete len:170 (+) Transcript_56:140-649(+)|eukprot:CAMPEP_0198723022 /NCGR_PEP_ID=MMETSP1475-20131203/585_1 /TAXON_ID= ORGANISM="Unidentified sp., Strain CCMP1999" /NCGR_SAMPLE_ID=MMETSP1475 /ASSEMBLY_ACC=CAM_ASM_001111 /LENGTH=169 /DNA_ID=CAMNT_0044484001 /DNA_START=63 /DNA_END=572 /DNA_ORIENTATION=+
MKRNKISVSELLNNDSPSDGEEPAQMLTGASKSPGCSDEQESTDQQSVGTDGDSTAPIRRRKRWTPEEDSLLIKFVGEQRVMRWNVMAEHFPGRDGQHLRLRWMNHLRPYLDKNPWNPEEDKVILKLQEKYGNSWVKIAAALPGRSDNAIKNRFFLLKRYQGQGSSSQR